MKTKEERAQELVDLIEAVVSPDVWKEQGGPATIRYYNGMLVVTAPPPFRKPSAGTTTEAAAISSPYLHLFDLHYAGGGVVEIFFYLEVSGRPRT